MLVTKDEFCEFLSNHSFNESEVDDFWEVVYREGLFTNTSNPFTEEGSKKRNFVSFKAFIYNFKKIYADEIAYKNMFSQPTLKQRLIDLRNLLQPWYDRNIFLKSNVKDQKNTEFQILEMLKK